MTYDLITLGEQAKVAARFLAMSEAEDKNNALQAIISQLEADEALILAANEKDVATAKENQMTSAMIDRLTLIPERLSGMRNDIHTLSGLKDPIGTVDTMWKNEDGLMIGKQRVPLGVIGMIYEARPNVTTDAATLCFKSGNAIILRGGKEAFHSNQALVASMQKALVNVGFPQYAIQLVEDTSRETAQAFMKLNGYLDVLIPRGGASLIQTVLKTATVPVIETGTGNCHVYVDKDADLEMALNIVVNGKCQRPSVCNATETLIVHQDIADSFLKKLEPALAPFEVELRADKKAAASLKVSIPATEEDFATEFNDFILAVKVVDSYEEAVAHIHQYTTHHSEVIVTENYTTSQNFLKQIDAAAVYINASSRFTDGSVFGFGGEIGISTQKLHARGPMGLNELTSTKYIIYGNGQVRK